jgi:hypothetical protein
MLAAYNAFQGSQTFFQRPLFGRFQDDPRQVADTVSDLRVDGSNADLVNGFA